MTLEDLIDRTERRLDIAFGIGEPKWINKLEARLARYHARLEARHHEAEAVDLACAVGATDCSHLVPAAEADEKFVKREFVFSTRRRKRPRSYVIRSQIPEALPVLRLETPFTDTQLTGSS